MKEKQKPHTHRLRVFKSMQVQIVIHGGLLFQRDPLQEQKEKKKTERGGGRDGEVGEEEGATNTNTTTTKKKGLMRGMTIPSLTRTRMRREKKNKRCLSENRMGKESKVEIEKEGEKGERGGKKAGPYRRLGLQLGEDPSFSLQFSHILRLGEAPRRLHDACISLSLSTHTHAHMHMYTRMAPSTTKRQIDTERGGQTEKARNGREQ